MQNELFIDVLIGRLRDAHPDAHCALNYETPFQLLVATILSAQCTDERVNKVTPTLFETYTDIQAFVEAPREELQMLIRSTGFYRQKARFIQTAAHQILTNYNGSVPDNMSDLLTLTGVARKTANVILGEIYHIADGITVDTHVKRLAKRLGLTDSTDPNKVEKELMTQIPQDTWIEISHLLIFHGRRVCSARKPDCPNCTLHDICPSSNL